MNGPVYVANPSASRSSVMLESLLALYHASSGATHLLAPPAPQILTALEEGPADAAEIVARLARDHDLEGDAFAAITARLAELEASGLVRRA